MNEDVKAATRKVRADFHQVVIGCAATVAGIHVLDAAGFLSRSPNNTVRCLCTLAYFAALILFCATMLKPRSRYVRKTYEWRFEDCPLPIEDSWKQYLHSTEQAVGPLAYVVMAFAGATGLRVAAAWFSALGGCHGLLMAMWYVSLLMLLAYPYLWGVRMQDTLQRRRLLQEQLVTSHFKPRAISELSSPVIASTSLPVVINGPSSFRAGQMDWDWEDFTKSCVVLGQPGTGKTVCVLNALLDGLMGSSSRAGQPCGALILDPKGDFRQKITYLCQKYNRASDLLTIDPNNPEQSIRWNPFDSAEDELELAERFAGVMETLGMKANDTSYWRDSAKNFICNAIALIRATNPPGEPPSIPDIARMASSFENIADRVERLDLDNEACDLPLRYFGEEWMQLAPETRTSVQSHISNMLNPFLTRKYARMFSGPSTMRVAEMLDQGKILYVDMPLAEQPAMARMVGTFLKLEYFREVLRRLDKKRPSLFLCDEFQSFFTYGQGKGDSDFFDKSRQSYHANLIATQNVSGLIKQCEKEEHAETLLGLCQVKIFLRNTDHRTNEYASKLFGEVIDYVGAAGGMVGGQGGYKGMLRQGGANRQAGGQWGRKVRPERFTELAIPARTAGFDYCESIIHLAARPLMEDRPVKRQWKVYPLVSNTGAPC